ncbi:Carbonic anhydrase-related protein 10 [Halocaridina rubra]|uniref:Carbonic anhydrase-related protein 10 n=1 Tax=Halocaridina rubra TaxID=373956 RepID=A0AAN8X556_HALRR
MKTKEGHKLAKTAKLESHLGFVVSLKRPDFWGLINPEWSLCSKGRRQSPIDIDPARLLYDPNLRELRIDKHKLLSFPLRKSAGIPPRCSRVCHTDD